MLPAAKLANAVLQPSKTAQSAAEWLSDVSCTCRHWQRMQPRVQATSPAPRVGDLQVRRQSWRWRQRRGGVCAAAGVLADEEGLPRRAAAAVPDAAHAPPAVAVLLIGPAPHPVSQPGFCYTCCISRTRLLGTLIMLAAVTDA